MSLLRQYQFVTLSTIYALQNREFDFFEMGTIKPKNINEIMSSI